MQYAKTPRLRRTQVLALTLLVIAGFVNYLDRSTLAVANSTMSHELSFSPTQMGLLLAVFSWAYAVAQLPIGGLLDRFGARVTLAIGMCVWSIAQAAIGVMTQLSHLLAARVLLGLGEAPQFPAGAKVVSEWFHPKERGVPSGIFNMSSSLGPAISQPILSAFLLAIGWRATFMTMGALGVGVAFVWYLVYRDRRTVALHSDEYRYLAGTEVSPAPTVDPAGIDGRLDAHHAARNATAMPTETPQQVTMADWRGLFKLQVTWGLILGYVGVIYMTTLFLTWLPAYFQRVHGISLANAGWVSSIPFLFGTLGVLSGGAIVDGLARRSRNPWASRRWPIACGLLFAALATVATAYVSGTASAIGMLCVAMFALNVSIAGAWSMVSVAVPSRMVASLASLQNFGGYFGGAFAPLITGMVVQKTGSFTAALVISAVVAIGGALAYLFLTAEPRDQPRESDAAPRPIARPHTQT
ncbi:MFS transporter [Robbsia sp. KACC 23696]|uniref:MFS transporter n=1 Tax=Robbsia sp. KACC 23696 TaxID=3149231 RepID=UPI00325AED18